MENNPELLLVSMTTFLWYSSRLEILWSASDFIKYFILSREDDTVFYRLSFWTVILVFDLKYAAL